MTQQRPLGVPEGAAVSLAADPSLPPDPAGVGTSSGWRHKIEWLHALALTPDVPPAVMRLAIRLTFYASSTPPFDRCRPAIQTLADEAGTTRAKVSERLRELRENAWLAVVHQGGGRKSTTEYRLTLGAPRWCRFPYPRLTVPNTGTDETPSTVPTPGTVGASLTTPNVGTVTPLNPSPPGGRAPSPPWGQEPGIEPGSSMAESALHGHSGDARGADAMQVNA